MGPLLLGRIHAEPELGRSAKAWHDGGVSALTIDLPDSLNVALMERLRTSGADSKEEYLLRLVESDCAAGELEQVLAERMRGPFALLEMDWRERVRSAAST